MNTNFALAAGLSPAKDAIARETGVSPYAGIIAVREQDKSQPWVAQFVKAYQSPEVRKFVETEFKGALSPAF